MTQTVSRQHLAHLIERLNARLNRPATYTEGHLYISTWSPGDGWTRYQLCEVTDHAGEFHPCGDRVWTRSEMYAQLTGMHAALDLAGK